MFTLRAGHGAWDDGAVVDVLAAGGVVVFSASVQGAWEGPCTCELRLVKVSVRLRRRAGDWPAQRVHRQAGCPRAARLRRVNAPRGSGRR